ncbi:MAG TPA: endonuclease/exonuclease/phosphatase family protein [Egibacteraceae bacterium]|nr:endonuclease/exonuclease/phosphatase family protein [Egibacteraceae bacterium]
MTHQRDRAELRVLTLNLWGVNESVEQRMPALIDYLRAAPADIVALQEVDSWGSASQADHVAEALGLRAHVIRSGPDGVGGEGLAVLSAVQSDPVATVHLPSVDGDHARALQVVDVRLPWGVVRVGNTHLTWPLDADQGRAQQARAIAEALAGWDGPAVVLGDLNDVPRSPALSVLEEAGFIDAFGAAASTDRATFDQANPYMWQHELAGRRVDHILARGLRPVAADVILTGEDAPIVSDHFGVRAILATR